ncbi:UbiA family prenyltransferase [Streptomyces griseoviridis]|uniref:UbiA family prenyltransferase n=1 Tax=Streptomyces griseoviridis TaxID=45398 RepID=UPI003F566E39
MGGAEPCRPVGGAGPRRGAAVSGAAAARPAGGAWLLVVPGWIAVAALAGPGDGIVLGPLLPGYGALSGGAACGLNDVLDARFDAQVPRTAGRPVASGRLAAGRAVAFCGAVGTFVRW